MGFPRGFSPGVNGSVFRKHISALPLALMRFFLHAKSAWSIATGSKGLISPEVSGLFLVKCILGLDLDLAFAFPSAGGGCVEEPVPGSAAARPPPAPRLCCRWPAGVSQIRTCPEQPTLAFLV